VSARSGGRLRDALQTALRLFPWPTEPGLRPVGEPGAHSPVIVTGNYDLTVRRLLRALQGLDCWVVVAPSGGINVWCAASGGLLTTHQVVTALKTSGIAERVRHRRAILPQLAATGVLPRDVTRRCGWRTRFGPVRADDLPDYLATGRKTDAMRHVRFGPGERLEMAVAWAAPAAVVVALTCALLRPAWTLPGVALAIGLALAVFFLFDRLPEPRRLLLSAGASATALALTALAGGAGAALLAAGLAAPALCALLTFDYAGSTPLEGCKGVYSCWEVCPEACFEKCDEVRQVAFAHEERCIRCGACIVQCPLDALAFESEVGERIDPDVIRRFKLDLLGRRRVGSSEVSGGVS
jgi:ferredoxin